VSRIEDGLLLTTVDWAPAGGWLVVRGSSQIHFIDASGAGEVTRFRKVDQLYHTQVSSLL